MPYTPNPDDVIAPTLSTLAGTAQAEFIALKEKINNLFLASDYQSALLLQGIKAGTFLLANLPAGNVNPGIMYGHAVNITRNDLSGGGATVVAAQLSAIWGNNLDGFAKNIAIFGVATEAWTGPIASHATLIGGEFSVISQYNANEMALVGGDFPFKNRNDLSSGGLTVAGSFIIGGTYIIIATGTTNFTLIGAANSTPGTIFVATGVGVGTGTATGSVSQGLGANQYNKFSRAIQITAQPRSGAGENCGWFKGIQFFPHSMDYVHIGGVQIPGVAIDIANFSASPATQEPWTAYCISSALALSEYMSITWDYLKFTRSYLDSVGNKFVILGIGNSPTTTQLFAFNYVTNNIELPGTVVGAIPGAITASMRIKIGATNYYIGLTAA